MNQVMNIFRREIKSYFATPVLSYCTMKSIIAIVWICSCNTLRFRPGVGS